MKFRSFEKAKKQTFIKRNKLEFEPLENTLRSWALAFIYISFIHRNTKIITKKLFYSQFHITRKKDPLFY